MAKRDYPYADDEFDAPSDPDAPRGVHRAPRSAWSRWWPFLAVLVLTPVLAFAAVSYLSDMRGSDGGEGPTTQQTTTSGASSEPTATASSPEPQPTEQESEPAQEPDLTAPVVVLNAAGVDGLAARTAAGLEDAGFTSVQAETFSGTPPAASVVRYASPELEATARLVAETIGVDDVELAEEDVDEGVVAILTTDPDA